MADPFQPQLQGRTLKLSARTFNGLQKAGQDYSRRKLDENQTPSTPAVPLPVQVFNALTYALEPFSVVQTDAASSPVDPAAVPLEAADAPIFNAIAPAEDGRPFFITREAIPVGGIGDVVTTGPAVVWVDVTDASHGFATVSAGIVDCLVSSATQGVPILWKESGTGLKLAQVMLGGAAAASPIIRLNSGQTETVGGWLTITGAQWDTQQSLAEASRLYFSNFVLVTAGVTTFRFAIGSWPTSYATPDLAAAASKLVLFPGFNSYATDSANGFAVMASVLRLAGDYPLSIAPVYKIVSGSPTLAGPIHFSHIG
jgi:hypothetical protein